MTTTIPQRICIIDDQFPLLKFPDLNIDDKTLIEHTAVNYFVRFDKDKNGKTRWDDLNLFKLIKALLDKKEYIISAFSNHEFFLTYCKSHIYSPDLIIFDWDMADGGASAETKLQEIVEKIPSPVAIYTGYDKTNEIDTIIKNKFSGKMVFLHTKSEEVDLTFTKMQQYAKYFVVKKSHEIRKKVNDALDSIFVKMKSISIDEFIFLFGENDSSKSRYVIHGVEMCDTLIDKLSVALSEAGMEDWISTTNCSEIKLSEKQIMSLWNFRLYSTLKDGVVRQGDIFQISDDYFFVIASDCHLSRFWEKTLGRLLVVPLHELSADSPFVQKIKEAKLEKKLNYGFSSLVSCSAGCTVLPGIQKNNGSLESFFLYTKDIMPIHIATHFASALTYEHIKRGEDKATFVHHLIEPFNSALVSYVTKNLTDLGVVDFSKDLNLAIKEKITTALK